MSLKNWEDNDWLKAEPTSKDEIQNLLVIVERDMKDAEGSISTDWQFGIAYNAALKLCTVLLRAEGYRPSHGSHHYRTIMAMPLILGSESVDDAEYLNACRMKRNTLEYDYAGCATRENVSELLTFVKSFRQTVLEWLKSSHPNLA